MDERAMNDQHDPSGAAKPVSTLARYVPILRWLPGYRPAWIVPDALAGLTVWALVVPEAMAYAGIAGVPVEYGLYAVPLAVLGYAVFGTSRHLFVGPSSTIAVLVAATVAPLAAAGDDRYVAMVAALSLLVGVLYIVLGLLRSGWVARFFAKPVLDGFIIGLGTTIAVGQLHKLVGVDGTDGNAVRQAWDVVRSVGDWNPATAAVGFGALALLFALGRFVPRAPAALVVLVAGIALAEPLGLVDRGVELVGAVPTGFSFVPWSGITLDDLAAMVPGALAIVVVGFAESLAVARSFAAKDPDEDVEPNQELTAYGVACLGAGALQGFPVSGSLSKSAAASQAGGKTPVTFVVVAVLVVLTIAFLAGVFADLPEAVLAAVVIHAVWGMLSPAPITRLRRASLPDFWLALGAALGVLLVGITPGIVIGIVLSLVLLIHRLDHPHVAVLGRTPSGRWVDAAVHEDATPRPGVLVFRPDAPLIFANAGVVATELRSRLHAAHPRPSTVVIDGEAVYEVDTAGAEMLALAVEGMEQRGSTVRLARFHNAVRDYLERTGVLDELGRDRFFTSVDEAVQARPTGEE